MVRFREANEKSLLRLHIPLKLVALLVCLFLGLKGSGSRASCTAPGWLGEGITVAPTAECQPPLGWSAMGLLNSICVLLTLMI